MLYAGKAGNAGEQDVYMPVLDISIVHSMHNVSCHVMSNSLIPDGLYLAAIATPSGDWKNILAATLSHAFRSDTGTGKLD